MFMLRSNPLFYFSEKFIKKRQIDNLIDCGEDAKPTAMTDNRDRFFKKGRVDELSDCGEGTSDSQPPIRMINLAQNECLIQRRSVPPIIVYVGNQLFLEVKEFKKKLYAGLYKEVDGSIRNRFNFPLAQIEKVEEGFKVLKDHVKDSGN